MQDSATVVVDVKLLKGDPKLGKHWLGHELIPAFNTKNIFGLFCNDLSKEFLLRLYLGAQPWGIQMENFALWETSLGLTCIGWPVGLSLSPPNGPTLPTSSPSH